ncbi:MULTISPECIES: hypothetical protein [Sorangium]|nr:hypothetical protein [Sorangium cellulosum]
MPNDGMPDAPHGATIETFATLSAEIAVGARLLHSIIAERGISPDAWDEITAHFTRLLAFDGSGDLVARYSRAFAATQDRLLSPPEMTVEAWAKLSSDVAHRGIAALVEHHLDDATYIRLGRSWAERLAKDPPLAHRYHQAFFAHEASRKR